MSRQAPPQDPNLLCVVTEIKRVKNEINELEWDNKPYVHLVSYLEHLLNLYKQGIMVEPKF